jgi:hypothetical protein
MLAALHVRTGAGHGRGADGSAGLEIIRPGFTRVSLSYFASEEV